MKVSSFARLYSAPILAASASTVVVPGEVGERAAETEADSVKVNFRSLPERSIVPLDNLTLEEVPFRISTLPLAFSPIVFVPVVDFVFSPDSAILITSPGIVFLEIFISFAEASTKKVSFWSRLLGNL